MDGRKLLWLKVEPGVGVEVREAPAAAMADPVGPELVADPDCCEVEVVWPSAGLRERWRPRCMWRSQYF